MDQNDKYLTINRFVRDHSVAGFVPEDEVREMMDDLLSKPDKTGEYKSAIVNSVEVISGAFENVETMYHALGCSDKQLAGMTKNDLKDIIRANHIRAKQILSNFQDLRILLDKFYY